MEEKRGKTRKTLLIFVVGSDHIDVLKTYENKEQSMA
jgi:hypothetical protein